MTTSLSSTHSINLASKQRHRLEVPQRNLDLWQALKSSKDIVKGTLLAARSTSFFCYSLKEIAFYVEMLGVFHKKNWVILSKHHTSMQKFHCWNYC